MVESMRAQIPRTQQPRYRGHSLVGDDRLRRAGGVGGYVEQVRAPRRKEWIAGVPYNPPMPKREHKSMADTARNRVRPSDDGLELLSGERPHSGAADDQARWHQISHGPE